MQHSNLMRYKSPRRQFLALLVALTLAASASAQQSQQSPPPQSQQSRSSGKSQKFQRESAPELERVRAHIAYLASEKLEGRRTGTAGAEEAARYIARELAKHNVKAAAATPSGLVAGRMEEGLLRSFPYVAGVEAGKANALTFSSRADANATTDAKPPTLDLRLGEDWMPLGWSANGRAENLRVAFVGYGIAAREQQHDDYAAVEVDGGVALAFAGTPDGDNPHGQFARFADPRIKAAAARERGARALALIAREDDFKNEPLARLRYDNSGVDAGIHVLVVSRAAARRMLEAGGVTASLEQLEKSQQSAPTATAAVAAPQSSQTPPVAPPSSQTSPAQHSSQTPTPSAPQSSQATTPAPQSSQAATTPEQPASQASLVRRSLSVVLTGVKLDIAVDLVRRRVAAYNVVGLLEGADAKLKHEYVVVGAHYDHLGRGGAGSLAAREGEVHHGADDNASGVAGLLELARLLSAESARPRRTLVFIAFGGEEEGLLGSNYYVNHPVVPLEQTVAMINLDMIGRLKNERLMIGGVGTASEWRELVGALNRELDVKVAAGTTGAVVDAGEGAGRASSTARDARMPVVYGTNGQVVATGAARERFALTLNEDGYGPSDHSSFYAKKIPVLFFFTGTHEDYHKPTDTAERINYEGHARVVGFVRDIVRSIDARDARPAYSVAASQSAGRGAGFRVYLGTIPSYAESETGMKLDAVRDDSPASRAGLRAGDVIVRLAGRDVRNVYDYTNALSAMRAGQEYDVEVVRAGERLAFKITPAARR